MILATTISIYAHAQSSAQALQTEILDLNDISILLPLPTPDDWNLLPQGKTIAHNGMLLPLTYLKQIPQLIGIAPNEKAYPMMRVVGIRLDPCFHEGPAPIRCQAQIRMVWQVLAPNDETTSTFDAALHSFYNLTDTQFKELLSSVIDLKLKHGTSSSTNTPLAIHPILQSEGLSGPYYTQLINLIYQYVGEGNLSRVTFMQLFMNGNIWEFGGFDIKDQNLTPITIARTNTTTQQFKNSATPEPIWFLGGMTPEVTQDDNLNFLIHDSRLVTLENENDIIAATRAAYRFENPKQHNPGTLDCVSCHVAQASKEWALQKFPTLNLDVINQNEIYQSPYNLKNLSPMQNQTNILRAFGYFLDSPIIAQRTINESADVLDFIRKNF